MLFRFCRRPFPRAALALLGLMSLGAFSIGCSAAGDTSAAGAATGPQGGAKDAGGLPGLRESCFGPEMSEIPCQSGLKCLAEARNPIFGSCDYPVDNPPGGCCLQHVDCMADQICSGGMCVPNTSGRCSPSLYTNALCAQGYLCVAGGAGVIDHCTKDPHPIPLGERCGGDNQCGEDGFCGSGAICTPRKGEGERCLRTPERQCKTGLDCDDVQVDGVTVSVCRPSVCPPIGQ
jgi:hypothetical protein